MKLDFEHMQEVGNGECPDILHFYDNEVNVLYVKDGRMKSKITSTPFGDWKDKIFEDEIDISQDDNITNFEIHSISGFGAIGVYRAGNTHKLLIYELEFGISEFLNNGSISHIANSPISSFSLTLENPKDPNIEHGGGNIAISEESSLLSPGAKITFKFSMGDSEEIELGTFYVDRSNYTVLSETVNVEGRNIIGKALKDQTFDEDNKFGYEVIHEHIKNILIAAKVNPYKIQIENTGIKAGYEFEPSMDYLAGLDEILKATLDWKIGENTDGTVVVGSPNYTGFETRTRYEFKRNKDIFSRNIVRDDMEAYRRVCVHDNDFNIAIYRDVKAYEGWSLKGNKTLYVNVPEGTSLSDAESYADEIAQQLEYVGKIESFTGPFRPHLLVGDEAVIISKNKTTQLGLITEITHRFGKSGFYTDFTVDSGGRLGKGRLTDYIGQVTKEKSSSRVYE